MTVMIHWWSALESSVSQVVVSQVVVSNASNKSPRLTIPVGSVLHHKVKWRDCLSITWREGGIHEVWILKPGI